MANTIKIKRGSGSDPAASDMVLGEPVLRTDTAELFFKKDDGSVAKVSGGGGGPDFKYLELRNAANNGAASYPGNDFTLVTSGTTNAITPAAANTLLVSVNGVIQKPNAGTSTSGITGFIVDGSRFKTATNLTQAPDFILYQESGGIGEPSDNTVSEEKLKVSNSPVNGYFLSAQSGNTGGLTWAAPVATSCTGNSATATALATARTINGTSFDGTANITVTAAAGTLTGNTLNSSVTASSLTSLGDLSGLTVTGNLAVDTNTLFVNASTNRVGIGTTSPTSPIEVSSATNPVIKATSSSSSVGAAFFAQGGSSNDSQLVLSSGTTAKYTFLRDGSQQDDLRIYDSANALDIIRYRHGSYLHFGVNGSERMRIDSSGNVGIGITSMDDIVHISTAENAAKGLRITNTNNSQASAIARVFISGGDNAKAALRLETNGQFHDIFERNTGELTIEDNGTERLRIDSSGRVGINTTSPRSLLDLGLGTDAATISNTAADYQLGLHAAQSAGGDIGRNIAFISQTQGTVCAAINTVDVGASDQTALAFATGNSSSIDERLRIDQNGRVLIGTTTEGQSTADDLTIATSASTGITIRSGTGSDGNIYFSDGTSGSDEFRGYMQYGHSTNALVLGTNSIERMRIDSAGRVLIGTTTEGTVDSDDLTIATSGNTGMTIRSGTTHNGAIHFSDATSGAAEYAGYIDYDHNVDKFDMGNNSGRFLSSDSNRVVSIGNASFGGSSGVIGYGSDGGIRKDSILALNASATVAGRGAGVSVGGNSSAIGSFYCNKAGNADSDGGSVFLESVGALYFRTNGANDRVAIDSAGAVRIAHTSFTADTGADDLIVGSTNSGINRGITILNHTGQDGRLCFGQSGDPDAGMIKYSHGSDVMQFFIEGTEQVRISSNGDIDIHEAIGQTHAAKVAVQHDGINPNAIFALATHASFQGTTLQSNASRNTSNGSYIHFKCAVHGVADKFRVMDSGAIQSTSNSIGGISDERLKENIVDAGSQWDDIKNIRVRKFNFKKLTDPEQKTMLGVVAQEAELVSPGLVESSVQLQEGVEQEYKTFKYSILYMKAIKALQEAQTRIETLETKVAALEAK